MDLQLENVISWKQKKGLKGFCMHWMNDNLILTFDIKQYAFERSRRGRARFLGPDYLDLTVF